VRLHEAERGIEFVEGADGLDLRVILRHPLAVEEAGRAVVPVRVAMEGMGIRLEWLRA